MSELLTLAEAAEQLHMSVATVRRYVHDGTLAGVKLGDTVNAPIRVPRVSVANFIVSHIVEAA